MDKDIAFLMEEMAVTALPMRHIGVRNGRSQEGIFSLRTTSNCLATTWSYLADRIRECDVAPAYEYATFLTRLQVSDISYVVTTVLYHCLGLKPSL